MLRLDRQKRPIFALGALIMAAGCASLDREPSAAAAAKPLRLTAPAYELSDVLGASAGDVDALLGPPALVRREGKGEYRRYGLKTCALIIILYPDETGAAKAAHVEATALTSDAEKPDPQACLAAG